MKPNIYYRSFYTLMTFFSRRSPDPPALPALLFLSLCLTANVYSGIMLLELAGVIGADLSKWSLFLFLLISAINYFVLVDGSRKQTIIRFYEKRPEGLPGRGIRGIRAAMAVYAFFSFALVLYLADLTRNVFT